MEDGSLTDLAVVLSRETTVEEINDAYQQAAEGPGDHPLLDRPDRLPRHRRRRRLLHLRLAPDPGQRHLAKVFGWYDNEWGYSKRLVDLTALVGQQL